MRNRERRFGVLLFVFFSMLVSHACTSYCERLVEKVGKLEGTRNSSLQKSSMATNIG
jgi:hypothetical protein